MKKKFYKNYLWILILLGIVLMFCLTLYSYVWRWQKRIFWKITEVSTKSITVVDKRNEIRAFSFSEETKIVEKNVNNPELETDDFVLIEAKDGKTASHIHITSWENFNNRLNIESWKK